MRWNLTEADKQAIVDKLMSIIASNDIPCAIRSMRLVLQMEQQNMQDENTDAGQLRQRLEALLQRLQTANEN